MTIFLLVLAGLAAFFVVSSIKVVPQAKVLVIERLGRFHRLAQSGLNIIIPWIEKPRPILLKREGRLYQSTLVELREQVLGFEKIPVITHDNVGMEVGSVIYYQIINPVKALYEIESLALAIEQLIMTNLRNVMGGLSLDETLTSRETVSNKLRIVLDEATEKWGVKVTRVELREIEPPASIRNAMALQMTAERERRAEVTKAEGDKASAVLQAEGQKTSVVLRAEGERDATIARAEGEKRAKILSAEATAEATRLVYQAIHDGKPDAALIAIKYLETMQAISQGDANKIFIPYQAIDTLGALGMVQEMLKRKDGTPPRGPGSPPTPGTAGSGPGPGPLPTAKPPLPALP
jgi:regulator of protease activity HflC (stomatin/prohibitin superfamily)